MNGLLMFALVVIASNAFTQSVPVAKVSITELSPPTYPVLARNARISGTVELNVSVRPDGTVESISVVRGHPLLNPAATESAQKTQFDCKDCTEPVTVYQLAYSFQLGEAVSCKGIDAKGNGIYDEETYTKVSYSQATISVFDRPFATCDPVNEEVFVKFRSAKCLFLWHCGKKQLFPL